MWSSIIIYAHLSILFKDALDTQRQLNTIQTILCYVQFVSTLSHNLYSKVQVHFIFIIILPPLIISLYTNFSYLMNSNVLSFITNFSTRIFPYWSFVNIVSLTCQNRPIKFISSNFFQTQTRMRYATLVIIFIISVVTFLKPSNIIFNLSPFQRRSAFHHNYTFRNASDSSHGCEPFQFYLSNYRSSSSSQSIF